MTGLLFALIVTVKTPRDLAALNTTTYILCALIGVAFVIAAAVLSQLVKFEGGSRPRDSKTRRMILWGMMLTAATAAFVYHLLMVASTVAPVLQSRFIRTISIGTGITVAVYVVLAFVLSKALSTGKLASWFPAKH